MVTDPSDIEWVLERFNVLKRLSLLKWVGLKPTRWRKLHYSPAHQPGEPYDRSNLYAEMPFNIVLLFTYPVFIHENQHEVLLTRDSSVRLGVRIWEIPPRCYVPE